MSLPFEKPEHTTSTQQEELTIEAKEHLVMFTKEIKGKENQKLDLDILVS